MKQVLVLLILIIQYAADYADGQESSLDANKALEKLVTIYADAFVSEGMAGSDLERKVIEERDRRLSEFANSEYTALNLFEVVKGECEKANKYSSELYRNPGLVRDAARDRSLERRHYFFQFFLFIRERRAIDWAEQALQQPFARADLATVGNFADFLARWGTQDAFKALRQAFDRATDYGVAYRILSSAVTWGPTSAKDTPFGYGEWAQAIEQFNAKWAARKYDLPERAPDGTRIGRPPEIRFQSTLENFKKLSSEHTAIPESDPGSPLPSIRPESVSSVPSAASIPTSRETRASSQQANETNHSISWILLGGVVLVGGVLAFIARYRAKRIQSSRS